MRKRREMKFKDLVEHKKPEEVLKHLKSISSIIETDMKYIKQNLERTEKNLALYNILRKAGVYNDCLLCSLNLPIEVLAFTTRSLFELNLLTKYILLSEDYFQRYVFKAADDRIDVLEGILGITTEKTSREVKILEQEIQRIKALKERFGGSKAKRLPPFKQMAQIVGLEDEYDSMYKLFSKYTHPSSFIINGDPEATHSLDVLNLFLAKAQFYLYTIIQKIREELRIGKEMK